MSIIEIYREIDELRPFINAAMGNGVLTIDVNSQQKVKNIYKTIVPGYRAEQTGTCNQCYVMLLCGLCTYYELHINEYNEAVAREEQRNQLYHIHCERDQKINQILE